MKSLFPLTLLVILSLISSKSSAQRYLDHTFTSVDSVIGEIYGTATNYKAEEQNLLFDFYSPSGDTISKRPLLIYIHGGGFNTGTRELLSVRLLCREMAKKGYAVANIDYRLDPNFDIYNSNTDRRAMTDAMHDAKQAIRFFKANATQYKIDTTKVFIGGESAGAATAMMAGYLDKQSELTLYPKANPNNPIGNKGNLSHSNKVAGTLCLCGLLLDTNSMETKNDPPLLWSHSDKDNFVPISLAFNIVLRAHNINLPYQTRVFKGGTHCPWYYQSNNWRSYLDTTITDIATFLYPLVTSNQTNIQSTNIRNWVKLYPNPSRNNINLNISHPFNTANIAFLDELGRKVLEFKSVKSDNFSMDISALEVGIYYLHIKLDGQMITQKIVKL